MMAIVTTVTQAPVRPLPETQVKRGHRVVHGDKELLEKLGRNDLCPCNSGRLFQTLLPEIRLLLMG